MKSLLKTGLPVAVALLVLLPVAFGQSPAAQSAVGTVTKIDAAAHSITLKTDQNQEIAVSLADNAGFRRIAPGETDLKNAATIAITDIAVGDRLLARGKAGKQSLAATLVVVMSQGDVAKKQAEEKADWDRRGVNGLVTAADAGSVTVSVRTLQGTRAVVITPAEGAAVRRYAPDSIKFSDAKASTLAEIKAGDQVRARGERSPDGAKMSAVEIVSGTFRTIAGVVLSIDAANNEVRVNDLDTKKPVVVKINPDSKVQKVPAQLAQVIAARLHPEAAAVAGPGAPGGPGAQRGPGAQQGGQGGPGAQRGPGGFAGRGGPGGPGAGPGRGGDMEQLLENSPAITLADLNNGDAIVVTSTEGATEGKITAISLLAGVEPILTKPGTQEMSIGSWSLGGGADGIAP